MNIIKELILYFYFSFLWESSLYNFTMPMTLFLYQRTWCHNFCGTGSSAYPPREVKKKRKGKKEQSNFTNAKFSWMEYISRELFLHFEGINCYFCYSGRRSSNVITPKKREPRIEYFCMLYSIMRLHKLSLNFFYYSC